MAVPRWASLSSGDCRPSVKGRHKLEPRVLFPRLEFVCVSSALTLGSIPRWSEVLQGVHKDSDVLFSLSSCGTKASKEQSKQATTTKGQNQVKLPPLGRLWDFLSFFPATRMLFCFWSDGVTCGVDGGMGT